MTLRRDGNNSYYNVSTTSQSPADDGASIISNVLNVCNYYNHSDTTMCYLKLSSIFVTYSQIKLSFMRFHVGCMTRRLQALITTPVFLSYANLQGCRAGCQEANDHALCPANATKLNTIILQENKC